MSQRPRDRRYKQKCKVMTAKQKTKNNVIIRLDFSRLHQSNQSYDSRYDLQHGRDWPTVPLQLLMRANIVLSVLRVQQAGCCTSLRPCRPAAAADKPIHARDVVHPQYALRVLDACIGAYDASQGMDRFSREARVWVSVSTVHERKYSFSSSIS